MSILNELAGNSFIIFCSTCNNAQRLALLLRNLGITAIPLHGQMSQVGTRPHLQVLRVQWGQIGSVCGGFFWFFHHRGESSRAAREFIHKRGDWKYHKSHVVLLPLERFLFLYQNLHGPVRVPGAAS